MTPISSSRIVPPSASAKRPFLLRHGARERAAHVAEQLRFDQRLGQRRAVDAHERHLALRAPVVNRARDELLAGAGLARDEHRAARLGDEPRGAHDFLDRPAPPDDAVVVELLVALGDEVVVVRAQPAVLDARGRRRRGTRRSRTASAGSRARRASSPRSRSRRWRARSSSGFAAARRRVDGARDLANEVEAAQLGHQVVDDQHVERPLAEQLQRLARTARRRDFVPFVAERLRPSAWRIFGSSSTSSIDPRVTTPSFHQRPAAAGTPLSPAGPRSRLSPSCPLTRLLVT